MPQVLQVLRVLRVLRVPQVLQVLPLLSWQAQAVSSLALMGSLLM
ncbi:MAG: hypothetical protein ACXWMO_07600 [Syntrophales bacterium]